MQVEMARADAGDDDDHGGANEDDANSSSEESDAAAEVPAARVDRSEHRDNALIAVYEARAAVPVVEGGENAQGRSQRHRGAVIYSDAGQSQRWMQCTRLAS